MRNYLSTEALSSLQEEYDVMFVMSEEVFRGNHPLSEEQILGTFAYNPKEVRLQGEIFQVLAWRHRKKSKTFFYRWLRQSNWNFVVRRPSTLGRFWALLAWVAGVMKQRSLLVGPLLGNRFIFRIGLGLLMRKHKPNEDLESFIQGEQWDLIIIPSAGFEPATFDAINVARMVQAPTLVLVDNWDNLVSKTVFWPKPDHVGVWGAQAKRQAIEVQGFEPHKISQIGTPRFDQYFSARQSMAESRGDYVLFVGSAMPFDELGALHLIEEKLSGIGLRKIQIVYRPHPWQQKRSVKSDFDEKDFRNTVLDRQIASAKNLGLQESSTDTQFQPDLSYYPDLFRNARIVIGPLTTMLIEASLCARPVIALSYDDGFHFTTSVKYFSHFDGMESVPGFQFCGKRELIERCLLEGLRLPPLNIKELDAALSEFLVIDNRPYPDRLLDAANKASRH